MKFSLVEMGQRFSFNGETYTKSSPLVANHEASGEKKFFRRADNVQPVFDAQPAEEETTASIQCSPNDIKLAFDEFYQQCIDALDENLTTDMADEKNAMFEALEQARQTFLQTCPELA